MAMNLDRRTGLLLVTVGLAVVILGEFISMVVFAITLGHIPNTGRKRLLANVA